MKIIPILYLLSIHSSMAMEDQEKMNDEGPKRTYSQAFSEEKNVDADEQTKRPCTDTNSYDRAKEKLASLQKEAGDILTFLVENANAGCPKANYSLGKFYEKGKWVKRDLEKAARFFEVAAKSDHPGALYKLGNFEIDKLSPLPPVYGEIVMERVLDQDTIQNYYAQAAHYYQQAVSKGHLNAHLALGDLYLRGKGVKQDLKEAVRLYDQAAQRGHMEAIKALVYLYDDRGLLQNYEKCAQLRQFLVSRGDPHSMLCLAWHYSNGYGVPKSDRNAAEYFHQGFLHRDSECASNLSEMYEEGQGVPEDLAKAGQYDKESGLL